MTEAEALTRINKVLDMWFRADITPNEALARIARITGELK